MADVIEDIEEVAEDDIDTNKTADVDGEWSQFTFKIIVYHILDLRVSK